ncbi:MAG: hypothetical protein U5J96_17245 [Ignavibacteriaceae bacterium]|nr:hypothetical protein [Ignavibacteriaceae bacterium]
MNRGIKAARKHFITNANTDDRLRKDALEILSSALIDITRILLEYADQILLEHSQSNLRMKFPVPKKQSSYFFPDYSYFHQLDRCLVCSRPMWRAKLGI